MSGSSAEAAASRAGDDADSALLIARKCGYAWAEPNARCPYEAIDRERGEPHGRTAPQSRRIGRAAGEAYAAPAFNYPKAYACQAVGKPRLSALN